MSETADDLALLSFGRAVCGNLAVGMRREWLVTNGLGGYASGTIVGLPTRRYHGLLVAALEPPVARTVLVAGLVEWVRYNGQRWPLGSFEYSDGTIDPHGYRHLQSFALEGMLPVWTFALADALLERRVWMAYGENTTYVTYRVLRASGPAELELTPLVTYRDHHALTNAGGPVPTLAATERAVTIRAYDGARPFHLLASAGHFAPEGDWWWNVRYRDESARGLDDRADLYDPGTFTASLPPGDSYSLTLTTEDAPDRDADRALGHERDRQHMLLHRAAATAADPVVRQLVLAADQFVVGRGAWSVEREGVGDRPTLPPSGHAPRPTPHTPRPTTIIAGYHWFNDWGRDTMIALPGLTLATGRAEDAADILRHFARYVADGLLPNNFPDRAGVVPGYNTVDATLWYFVAIDAYRAATGDERLVDDLLPTLREIVAWHRRGTRYQIGVDPADGLLHAGEPGVQLTWMDAKVGDWVVTPRIGKPVEINALWYNALRILARFLAARGESVAAADYEAQAAQVRASFRARFILPGGGLADVIDGPDGDDHALRPNQIFAVSLPFPVLEGDEAAAVVTTVGRALLTSYGLRSLAPTDPHYQGDYAGDPLRRDGAYHQGPVWTWLIGAYAEAHFRVHGDRAAALSLLQPFREHLADACIGSISEILEGDPPHQPRGAVAQAWGVAEVLRVWRALAGES